MGHAQILDPIPSHPIMCQTVEKSKARNMTIFFSTLHDLIYHFKFFYLISFLLVIYCSCKYIYISL
jgi:hypothetical protein